MQTLNATSERAITSAYSTKLKVQTTFTGPGRTKQAHKMECDINTILARYKRTGVIDFQEKHEPQYGDVTALEFQEAQFVISHAKGLFAAMPAHLRARFENDPGKFLAFVNDERNRNEAQDLGLLKPVKPADTVKGAEAPVPGPVANPPGGGGVIPLATP